MSSLPYTSGPSRRPSRPRTWQAAIAALLALSATALAQDDTGSIPPPAPAPVPAPAASNTTAAPAPVPAFALPAPVKLRLPTPNSAPVTASATQNSPAISAPRPSFIPAPTGVPAPVVAPQAAAPASVPAPTIATPAVQYAPPAPSSPAAPVVVSSNVTPPPNPAPGIATPINPPAPQNNAFAPPQRPAFGGPNQGFGGPNQGFGGRPGFPGAPAPQGAANVPGASPAAQNTTVVKADPAMIQASALLNGVADPNVPVTVNFTDEVAPQIVSWLAKYTDKIILQSQALPATRLNFTSNHDIPLAEAVFALQSLLNMNGVAILPMSGNIFRAVPNNDMTTQTPALLTDGMEQLPGNENVYSRFFHLNYITSDDAVRLLTPFMSPRISALISFERSNSIFVTDSLLNLQRIDEILKKADVESDMQEDTLYIQLHNAKSTDVMGHLTRLQTGPLRKYIGTNTAFEADDRTNTIIVVTPKSESELVKKIITSLDADVDPTTRAELFKIKQAVSGTVVQLLQQIVTGSQQNTTRPTTGTQANNSPASTSNPVNGGTPPPAPAAPAAAPAGGRAGAGAAAAENATRDQQFSPYVTIVSDDRSNSIVVYGTASDIRQIGDLINKVDVILPQVRIEAVITEVTLTKGQVSGLSSFGLSYHFLPGNTTTGTSGSAGGSRDVNITTGTNAPPNSSTPAFTFSGSLTNFGLDTVFNIASTNDKVKVLSAPNITTTHNSQATIQVTENYPIVTSTTTQIQNAASVGNNVTQTVTYSQIGITLQVQPLIGDNGVIQMNITQNDENIISFIPVNGIEQPIIGQREATSFISVKDGEVIVLGGLQQTNHNVEHDKVFFLGDLPLIGQLFQPTTYSDSTSELIIFIKPTIIHSSSAADIIAKETVSSSLASKSVADYLKTGVVSPPTDPDLSTPPSKQTTPPPGLNK